MMSLNMAALAATRWRDISMTRKGALVICIPLFAILLAAFFSIWAINEKTKTLYWIEHSVEVTSEIDHLKTATVLLWAEHLNFLLHGPDRNPASASLETEQYLNERMARLSALVSDNADQTAAIEKIREASEEWCEQMHAQRESALSAGKFPVELPREELLALNAKNININSILERAHLEEQRLLDTRLRKNDAARTQLYISTGIVIILGLLGSLLCGAFFVWEMGGRLASLTNYVATLGSGLEGIPPEEARDEIGALASAFHNTTERLRDRERELKEAKSELEERFAERGAALHESEVQYRLIVENVQDYAIMTLDTEGRVSSWNRGATRILGYSKEEILSRHFSCFFPNASTDSQERPGSLEAARKHGRVLEEGWRVRKDGSRFWAIVNMTVLYDDEGEVRGFIKIVRDITERMNNEMEIERSRKLLDRTGRIAKVGGWEIDVKTMAMTWTEELYRIYEVSEIPSFETAIEYYPEDVRSTVIEAVQECIQTGTPFSFECPLNTARGRRIWIQVHGEAELRDGKPFRLVGTIQDTTERKVSEEMLKQANLKTEIQLHRLQLLGEITKAIAGRHDTVSLFGTMLTYLRDNFGVDLAVILHFDRESDLLVVGGRVSNDFGENTLPHLKVGAFSQLGTNGLRRCLDGETLYVSSLSAEREGILGDLAVSGFGSAIAAPLRSNDMSLGILLVARQEDQAFNSTDCEFLTQLGEHAALAVAQLRLLDNLRRTTEDLRDAQEQMTQRERLHAMGEMASGIAHDINNTLGPVSLHCELMLEAEELSEQGRKGLQVILEAIEGAASTISQLREFYRPVEDAPVKSAINMNKIVEQVVVLAKPRWKDIPQREGYHIELSMDLCSGDASFQGFEGDVRNALTNLVINASDAMPSGGKLGIRTRIEEKHIVLEVIDTGEGMDEFTKKRCIDPFFSTKGRQGTGLGLSMVYGVMKRHGGLFDISSKLGQGTTVRLSFPIVLQEDSIGMDTNHPLRPSRALRILCVDDDPAVRKAIVLLLEHDGHSVTEVGSGASALAECSATGEFDVVLTDLGMPGMDGKALAVALKAKYPEMPVILLTGWGSQLLHEAPSMEEFTAVLAKPPRINAIRQALAEACG
ncbi:MAG: hypothetical protein PWP23_2744 [Candidatus Sumerlaeota bacterium]|nr:hypothetical protein [Candidatus Sumerlaeota bacterium]